jgi:parallel beta-helix repeat protein
MIRQADGIAVASFPRVSTGWIDFDTVAFEALAAWYISMGEEIKPLENRKWTYAELIKIERKLAGDEYGDIFQITEPSLSAFPEERPCLPIPEEFDLTDFAVIHTGEKVTLTQNTMSHLFNNCEVWIATDNIKVSESKFVNSKIIVNNTANVAFERVIFKELNQYEQASLSINNSHDITVNKCQFVSNYIGIGIHSSSANIEGCRFEHNNGHNALVIGEGSSANVEGSYFYGSFPHAILIMNREGESHTAVNISHNYIDQTGEDAINFEDYRNAAPSNVSHNIITNSGWAALVVEYNSWKANITIEDNWIENTGIDWKLPTHNLQTERFQSGWGHGILVEDSSQVRIINNRIISATENGVEIRNSRDVVVEGNGIACKQAGIGVYRYNEYSLYRDFSPLSEENAGSSQVKAHNNVIYSAQKDYDVDESCQFTLAE